MSLTRKHYVMLAAALQRTQPARLEGVHPAVYASFRSQWDLDVESIAGKLAADNKAFDRARFIKAAQGDKE